MTDNSYFSIEFMTEKIVGHGEDAPPLLIKKENGCAVGVFDGMGGSGAAICESDFEGYYTKAYVASRIVSSSVQVYLDNHISTNDIQVNDLKDIILTRLKNEQERFPPKSKSLLRSKLVRDYPTTMSIVTLMKSEKSIDIDSYWAGDSHCYIWNKDGFFQISIDDLEEKNDPMENLHNDSPISNCICADRDFTINHRHLQIFKEPVIILCATDGCFGYYSSPMHFENMLKECLKQAKDVEDWKERIEQCVQQVTGDDSSLALIAVGFSSFDDIKCFAIKGVEAIKEILKAENNLKEAQQMVDMYTNEYKQSLSSGWGKYKKEYMRYINDEDYANA